MMDTIGKGRLGKFFIGGCGTQVGMAISFVLLIGAFLFCSVCAFTNVLSIAVVQEIARLPANPAVEVTPAGEVQVLQQEVESLVSQVEMLQANTPSVPPAAPTPPPPPKPIVIAHKNGVDLRSGPGPEYTKVGLLKQGGSLEIVGRNGDSSWWLVSTPNGLAWVSADAVMVENVNEGIPVVTTPALLVLPTLGDSQSTPASAPTPTRLSGTPTADAAQSRIFVEDTVGYKELWIHLSAPPISESFSPRGDQIAIIEGVKLHSVAGDGSDARVLFADDGDKWPVGDAVWSPDGEYIAFVVKRRNCNPCRSVGLVHPSDGSVSFLKTLNNMDSDAPRWTQDGRLLVNVHPGEPADGTTYVYDTSGGGQVASGVYVLSSSHEGQKWLPWLPGRTWKAGVTERPDAYYSD
jgi:uncharacterized protein YraI